MNWSQEALEELARQSAMNMGPAQDMWVPEWGWILRDGELTETGIEFCAKYYGEKKND